MAVHYVAGRPGSKTDENIVISRANDSSTGSPSRDNTNTPVHGEDESMIGSGAGQESTPPSTGTAYNTPVPSPSLKPNELPQVKTAIAPAVTSAVQGGHKSRLSGSTVVSSTGHENTAKDEQSDDKGRDAGELSPDNSSNYRELDPATPPFVPKGKGKHHCSTEDAISEGRRIYIGNLKFTLERDDIAGLLETCGVYKPECCCIYVPPPSHRKNPKTTPEHRNRGYCFATFTDSDSATTAMKKLDHIIFADRKLVCRCCLPKGVSYSFFLGQSEFIEQRGILNQLPPPRREPEVQEQGDVPPDDPFSTSHGPSPQRSFHGGSSPYRRTRTHRHQPYYQPYSSPRVGAPGQQRPERSRRLGLPRSPRHHYQQKKYDPLLEQNFYAHYYYPYHHYDDNLPGFLDQQQVVVPEPWLIPEYHRVTYWSQPPASVHHEVLLASLKRDTAVKDTAVKDTAVKDTAVEDPVIEETVVAGNAANENSNVASDNNDVYIPPKESSQADGKTIELLNLEPVSDSYRDFKAFIKGLLAGTECDVTGVSEAIWQYNPSRPRPPLVQNSGGSAYISCPFGTHDPETPHNCPLIYCYVQFATKDQAVRASKELDGKLIRHGGEMREYRVNLDWNLPRS